jgi:hypothetical protein
MLITNSRSTDHIDLSLKRTKLIFRKKFHKLRDPLIKEARSLTEGTIPTKVIKPIAPFARVSASLSFQGYNGKVQKVSLTSKGTFPLLPINKQKGNLRGKFKTKLVTSGQSDYIELYNTSRQGKFILDDRGTRKAIGRGFQKRLRDRMKRYKVDEN